MSALSANLVQTRAQAALAASPFYELRECRVDPVNGSLIISGNVSSFDHKQLAQEVVRAVCRDEVIVNSIDVADEDPE